MTTQITHKRISSKGKPFIAGHKKKVFVPHEVKGDTLLVISNMPYFKKLMTPLFNTSIEARINIGENKITASEMDPANVSLIQYKIENHNGISIRGEKPVQIGINTKVFNKAIKDIKKDVIVNISLKGDKLHISAGAMQTDIPILDMKDLRETKMPELKPKHAITLNGETFLNAIKEMKKNYDTVQIVSSNEGVELVSSGANAKIIKLDSTKMENSKSRYSIEYLMQIAPMLNKNTKVRIQWDNNYPLTATIEAQHIEIKYLLAPRIEEFDREADRIKKEIAKERPINPTKEKTLQELEHELKEAEKSLERFKQQKRHDDISMTESTIADIKEDITKLKEEK